MAAKIIPFPGSAAPARRQRLADTAGPHSTLDICIQFTGAPTALKRNASVHADDTLADLHRLITHLLGWDETHNYFFSHGSCRYEDPELFRTQDMLGARCRKIYSAADVTLGHLLATSDAPLHYVCNLVNCWELTISVAQPAAWEQFG